MTAACSCVMSSSGATVLLFAQRYQIARDQVTTAIAVSTFAALATVPIALKVSRALL